MFVLVCIVGIFIVIAITFVIAMNPSWQLGEYGKFMLYLYNVIYPYRMGSQFSMFYDPIFLMLAFGVLIFSVCISSLIRFSTFKTMIAFSSLIWSFSCIYILFNMVFYLFPIVENFMLTNSSVKWLCMFIYGMCPFVTLTLIIFFIFTVPSYRDRQNYGTEVKQMKAHPRGKVNTLLKVAAAIALIVMVIVFIVFIFT
jgi:hypothetical protein